MKLVAYLRVSTDVQAEKGLGLEVQERAIRSWAKANGHRVVLWCRDAGESGSNGVETRKGLHDALAALDNRQPVDRRAGVADGMVVYRLDRLARNLTIQETTLATAWAMGAAVFAVDTGEVPKDDPDDPMKTALRQMIGVFAQLERGMITARLRAGRKLKHDKGGYAGFGSPAYGSRAEGGALVVEPAEAAAVEEIRRLRGEGLSFRAIAAALDVAGHKPKRAAAWSAMSVRRVVERLDG